MSLSKTNNRKGNFEAKAFSSLLYLYAFFLPLRNNLKTFLLFGLLALFLWECIRSKTRLASILKENTYKALLAYYTLCLLSLFYSSDTKSALDFTTLQATLPILPLIVYQKLTSKQIQYALLAFSSSCILFSLYGLYGITTQYFSEHPQHLHQLDQIDWVYFSHFLPINVGFHAPYYSLYIGTALIIHTYFLYTSITKKQKIAIGGHLCVCLFLFFFQALLSSRTALLATILVIALVSFYLSLRAGRYLLVFCIVLLTLGTSSLALSKVTYLRMKVSEGAGVSERKLMWLSAYQVILENPILGVGAGDSDEALVEEYKKRNFTEGIENRYNAHNQFIMHGVSFGILGILVFCFLLYLLLNKAYTSKDYLLFCFISVFIICCLTESLWQRRDGILLFTFITSLLIFAPIKDQTNIPVTVLEKN